MEENNNFKKRKILFITGILGLILVIVLLLLFFRRGDDDSSWFGLFPGSDQSGERQPLPGPDERDRDFIDFQGEIPRLRQISFVPTAGAGTLKESRVIENDDNEKEEKELTIIRYTERQTGHVHETSTDSLKTIRISNTTIPRIYEALWLPGGTAQLVRYFDKDTNAIKTFHATLTIQGDEDETLKDPENAMELKGEFLVNNIPHLAILNSTGRIFYILPSSTLIGRARGISAKADGLDTREIFSSTFSEWLPQWPNAGTIALTTKASAEVPGFLYFLDVKTGSLERVLKDVPGLTTLTNPKGDLVLYSESTANGIKLSVYDVNMRESRLITLFNTLPEKCVWSHEDTDIVYCGSPKQVARAKYPDDWYKGQLNFSDNLWSLNARTMKTEDLINLTSESKQDIDTTKPFLDEDEAYLFFTNKRDMTVWSFRLPFISSAEEGGWAPRSEGLSQ